jgi:hypothetical protein
VVNLVSKGGSNLFKLKEEEIKEIGKDKLEVRQFMLYYDI